jgi:hypothetical protein
MINDALRRGSGEGCVYHLGHPDIFVMESAEEWDCCEYPNRLHGTTKRGVLFERKMGTDAIVIVGIGSEDPAQMGLAQDQDMVQASRRIEPISRSVCPFCQGERGAVGRSRMPSPGSFF